jgi:hypothetical protein
MLHNSAMANSLGSLRIEILDPHVVNVLRGKTTVERFQMAFQANQLVRERLIAHLRHEHPEWDQADVAREVARRILWNNPKS